MVVKFIALGIAAIVLLANAERVTGLFKGSAKETEDPITTTTGGSNSGIPNTIPNTETTPQKEGVFRIELIGSGVDAPRINSQDATLLQLSNKQQKLARKDREIQLSTALPDLTSSTSLTGATTRRGSQIKRDEGFDGASITNFQVTNPQSKFQQTLKEEQERAAQISNALFGNVQNPNFSKTNTRQSAQKTTNQERTSRALDFNNQVNAVKARNLDAKVEARLIDNLKRSFGF